MAEIAYLGLGSNLGDRLAALRSAVAHLAGHPQICSLGVLSSVYETDPVGLTDQPLFLNACAAVNTEAAPEDLLSCVTEIEKLHDRQRSVRWGPRTLDIDLLLYGDRVVETPELILPHPRMTERCFVLVPLCEIAPDLPHPVSGHSLADYCRELDCARRAQRIDEQLSPQ